MPRFHVPLLLLTLAAIAGAEPRHARLLAVGEPPPFRQEVRDGVRYELEPPAGSIPPREVLIGDAVARLRLGRTSEPLEVPAGAGPLVIARRDDAADAEPWLRLETPETGDFLVVLWRDPAAGTWEKARSMVLPGTAPAGSVRFVNASPATVGVVIAGEKLALKPGTDFQRQVPPGAERDFEIQAAIAGGGTGRLHSGTISQAAGERSLVLIYRADGESPRRPLKVTVRREQAPPAAAPR